MAGSYSKRPEFIALEEMLVDRIIYQALDIVEKRKPKTTFRQVFKKVIRVRAQAFEPTPVHRVVNYIRDDRFFPILYTTSYKLTHGKVRLEPKDVEDITLDTPIHEYFDRLEKLYVTKVNKEERNHEKV